MERAVVLDGKPYPVSEIMRSVVVRPVKPEQVARWKALIREHHYLGLHHLVGETILHVAEVEGHWVGLLGWCSAALKVSVRNRWIGWNPQQKQRRLKYGGGCAGTTKWRTSRRPCQRRLCGAWARGHRRAPGSCGHPVSRRSGGR